MNYTFTVIGPPVAKQRPRRAANGHWYTPKRTVDYEQAVAWEAKAAGVKLDPKKRYTVRIRFHLSTRRSDLDNLTKSILDGLNRMGDWDDRQVDSLEVNVVSVRDGSEEYTEVEIEER